MTVLVTGGTGLIGSNICRLLIEQGDGVRALVRAGSDHQPLVDAGVEPVVGDITDRAAVVSAAQGCDAIVHSAAVLGFNQQDPGEQRATNVDGARHVFDAAEAHGIRAVALSTTTFFRHDTPLTERSPVVDEPSDDPYTVTKAAAFRDAMQRVERGADVVVVVSGGAFGPGLSVPRAMAVTSFNRALRGALNGKLREYVRYPVPWVFAEDVAAASVAAITRGATGTKYLAFGREDAQSTASFLNVALEVAGSDERVTDVVLDEDDPDARERWGPSLVALARRTFPTPWFDNARTRAELGYEPRPLRDALEITVDWLRANGQIS
ncbi:MAG: NAD-dependent epimerase/dehydratase family protein [Acidimicrobiia bacterium]|nr:NAD-dependent epimerase/dehydratase family protein [Acidimicrobiia bacterium]